MPRVVGGWNEFQFAERRMPTLAEINAVSPDSQDNAKITGFRCNSAMRALGFPSHRWVRRFRDCREVAFLQAPDHARYFSAMAPAERPGSAARAASVSYELQETNGTAAICCGV